MKKYLTVIAQYWELYSNKYNERIERERLIIGLCILAGVYLAWDVLVIQPKLNQQQQHEAKITALNNELEKLAQEEQLLLSSLTNSPLLAKKREADNLRVELKNAEGAVDALSAGLVPARNLPAILHEVISARGKLELRSMNTLPTEKLVLEGNEVPEESEVRGVGQEDSSDKHYTHNVYKHAVELEVTGRYFDVIEYLEALENLRWKFYWQKLDYHVSDYPNARVHLLVYTLSTSPGILGT